jgi:hypothetical protein
MFPEPLAADAEGRDGAEAGDDDARGTPVKEWLMADR